MPKFVAVRLESEGVARDETFLGRAFRVIPAVLVRSQVLRNNLGVMFLPSEVITDEWASQWNGIPVLVGPHPSHNGQASTGRTPAIWDERGAGWIFNAKAEQESSDTRRLSAEIWLDVSRAGAINGLQLALDRVAAGTPVELSTGFAAEIMSVQGAFRGEQYEAVMHPAGADHLVISTEMKGACSIADGCGLGVNEFVMPKGAHTQEEFTVPANTEQESRWKAILDGAVSLFKGTRETQQTAWDKNTGLIVAHQIEARNAVTPSDQERANMICEDLQDAFGSQDKRVVVFDVYTDAAQVVFCFMTPFGPEPSGAEFYRISFTGGEGGEYKFDGTPQRVRRMTSYEPTPAENSAVAGADAGQKPCGCADHTSEDTMLEKDKQEIGEMLAGLLAPITTRLAAVETSATTAANAAVGAAVTKIDAALAGLTAKIDEASATAKAAAVAANADREAERKDLVTELSANVATKDLFTPADLEAKPLEELRKIAQLAKVEIVSFTGRGAPRSVATNSEELAFAPVVPYFVTKKDAETTNGTKGGA